MVAKSCLKHSHSATQSPAPSPLTSPRPSLSCSRNVSFRDKTTDEVHQADDWDRTPVDVTPRLTYDDILELKQMQVEATRQCARASAARGIASRYLATVPLALLPLLPEAPPPPPAPSPASLSSAASSSSSSRASSPPLSASGPTPASFGLALAEACLNKTWCADAGPQGSGSCYASSTSTTSSHFLALTQTPSPPVTPPRPLITSIPPPPPRRSFAFVPLLDASSSSSSASPSPALSPNSSSSSTSSSYTSNVKNASNLNVPQSPPPQAGPSAPSAYFSNKGAYGAYTPPPPSFVGGNATLGLERKLGFTFESDVENDDVESDEEDRAWPHDWPGQRHHQHKAPKQHPLSPVTTEHSPSSRKPPEQPSNTRAGATTKPPQPNSLILLPPSPPAEPCALPAVRTSPVRGSSPGSPKSCSPKAESPTSARKKTIPLVLLA